jgi:hypothetical protein
MKTDTLSFSFVTAIVLAGVIIAIVSPTRPVNSPVDSVAHAANHAPADPVISDLSHSETHVAE